MSEFQEKRNEKRLKYNWPIWFADQYNENLCQGQMVDISSTGAAFTCYADRCPLPGQKVSTRFSVPKYGEDSSFELENFIREGNISRVDDLSAFVRRVAVQFCEPLSFKPGEMIDDSDALLTDCQMTIEGAAGADNQLESVIGKDS